MEEDRIDELVRDIELITTEVNKINFDIDGLREEISEIEDKRPFLVRQLSLKNRKLNKLMKVSVSKTLEKQDLEVKLSTWKIANAAKTNPNVTESPKAESPKKEEIFNSLGQKEVKV